MVTNRKIYKLINFSNFNINNVNLKMKTIKKLPYMVALSLAFLIGCDKEAFYLAGEKNYIEKNIPKYQGYDVTIRGIEIEIGTLTNDRLSFGNLGNFDEAISAVVYDDSTVSDINVRTNKGSKLEELASVQKIREIYFYVKDRQKLLKQANTK